MNMRKKQWPAIALVAAWIGLLSSPALAAPALGTDVPACRTGGGPALPQVYLDLARRDRDFGWIAKVKPDAQEVQGSGWERVEGSGLRDDFTFVRVDLDGDGVCDWFQTSSAPQSSGGDRSSFNTLYLWRSGRWQRRGADMPVSKPDVLGLGSSYAQRAVWQFGDQLALLQDPATSQTWFITWHERRDESSAEAPGYRLSLWDSKRQRLVVQDKWKPDSAAAKVYAVFKAKGARGTGSNASAISFDPAIETAERRALCTQQRLGLDPAMGVERLSPPPDLFCTP